jgi:hypothetical protein
MSVFKKAISDKITENRPKLSPSSVKTYVSILFNLHKKITNKEEGDLDFFSSDEKKIFDQIENTKPQSRKSSLSALYILTGVDKYREKMLDDCKLVNNLYKEQKKSTKESDNWVSIDHIKDKYNGYLAKIKGFNTNTPSNTIVEFLLLSFLGGVSGLKPRRSLDYALLKIRNFDINKDNYYKSGKFVFNIYKTAKVYGKQEIELPKQLNTIIKKWIKINKTDYMLYSSNGNPLSSSQITKMLNKIFDGKSISTDLLRHIYLTNLYKDVPALEELENTASEMGHTFATSLTYVKKD